MLHADLRYDYVRTWFARLAEAPFAEIERLYGEMERRGREAVAAAGAEVEEVAAARAADMRYVGQEHAVTVDLPPTPSPAPTGRRSRPGSTRSTRCATAPPRPRSRRSW